MASRLTRVERSVPWLEDPQDVVIDTQVACDLGEAALNRDIGRREDVTALVGQPDVDPPPIAPTQGPG